MSIINTAVIALFYIVKPGRVSLLAIPTPILDLLHLQTDFHILLLVSSEKVFGIFIRFANFIVRLLIYEHVISLCMFISFLFNSFCIFYCIDLYFFIVKVIPKPGHSDNLRVGQKTSLSPGD